MQLKWQNCDPQTEESYGTLLQSLQLADQEDIEEEDDNRWFLPLVKKKASRKGKWVATNEYHERGVDLSEVGLRGSLNPANFGWDVQYVPDSEKEGFRVRQNILVDHYAWFRKYNPRGFWLRS